MQLKKHYIAISCKSVKVCYFNHVKIIHSADLQLQVVLVLHRVLIKSRLSVQACGDENSTSSDPKLPFECF